MSCTRRAEFESAAFRRLPDENSAFVAFRTPPPTDQKSLITLSTSNTTTAHTQMDLSFVGVQGHQKPLENTKTLMKIDVFLCLVVQEPGVYRGGSGSAPPDPPFLSRLVRCDPGISRPGLVSWVGLLLARSPNSNTQHADVLCSFSSLGKGKQGRRLPQRAS